LHTVRTTILLEDHLAEKMRARARQEGKSFSAFIADAGRRALAETVAPAQPFSLITYRGKGVKPGLSLDQPSALLAAEDQAQYGSPQP